MKECRELFIVFWVLCFYYLQRNLSLMSWKWLPGQSPLGVKDNLLKGENSQLVICKPYSWKLTVRQLSNNLVPLIEYIVEVHWMVASSTIRFNGLDNIMDSLEASHFKFPDKRSLVCRLSWAKQGKGQNGWSRSPALQGCNCKHPYALHPKVN